MKEYIKHHKWKIIEDSFNPEYNQITESLMSLGNGKMGQRANFEESYSGETLQGSYIAGVYYPDKTRVGWWKNGYPEYFAKVLNSVNWIGINIEIKGETLDLAKVNEVHSFYRELDMQKGTLLRKMEVTMINGIRLTVESTRIISMADDELGAISYSIQCPEYSGLIRVSSYLDFDVINQDRNYEEIFWDEDEQISGLEACYVSAVTRKTNFHVGASMVNNFFIDGNRQNLDSKYEISSKKSIQNVELYLESGNRFTIEKYVGLTSSMYHSPDRVKESSLEVSKNASSNTYEYHLKRQEEAWGRIWQMCDIQIDGDISAQQGIRFNIFQLYQTYTGKDHRLNIGPKGFTGEKYGGSTYWDTEAYCLPFYLSTADEKIAKNLLIYRYKQLDKAIENAQKLGFKDGAALYPMVTMTGEECHNEWEITFEEIHRNGAIAYAIYDYIRYTGDQSYLEEYGLEVLIAIARFWSQRVNWSTPKSKYVILGVTGPNEYENNVNNNWYTNYIASWCLKYAIEAIDEVKRDNFSAYLEIAEICTLDHEEMIRWQHIIDHMYYPREEELGIFLQQDNFMDKDQSTVDTLDSSQRPLNQKWSWDRILRSCYIKQADVLQGLYFFEDDFDMEVHRKNFEYYEPRTVHESSLSPCIHGILASKLGMHDKAYEMYLRTARLDLDDYNNDTEDGCHITSMAGTWMTIVKGFGGQRVEDDMLSFSPTLPKLWNQLSFKIKFRKNLFKVVINPQKTTIINLEGPSSKVLLNGMAIIPQESISIPS